MWNHCCPVEKTVLSTGDGEPCNWCSGIQFAHTPNIEMSLQTGHTLHVMAIEPAHTQGLFSYP